MLAKNVEIHTYGIIGYGVVAFVFSIYSIYVLIRAILKKRDGAILFMVGFFFLLFIIINDIFYDQSIIYTSVVGPVIRKHNGFIDKYIGDAIMALFDKTAYDAVRGAIGMLQKLVEYNEGRKRAGYVPIRIGIGINTGTLRIGTIGERGRMEGTVISDAVNIASRIEGMTALPPTKWAKTQQTP